MKENIATFVALILIALFSFSLSASAEEYDNYSYVTYDYGYIENDYDSYSYGYTSFEVDGSDMIDEIEILLDAEEEEAHCFQKTDKLPLGPAAIAHALTQVKSVKVTAYNQSRSNTWSTEIPFDQKITSQSQVIDMVKTIRPKVFVKDPREEIIVEAFLYDSEGKELFSAYSMSRYEKKYSSDGVPRWELPSMYISFYLEEYSIPFCDEVEEATISFTGRNSYSVDLEVEDGKVFIPGYLRNRANGTLRIEFADGTVVEYDSLTGDRIEPQIAEIVLKGVSIQGLRSFELNSKEFDLAMSIEFGGNSLLEFEPMYTGWSEFNINSWYGYRPIAAWINTMEGVGSGQNWEFVAVDWRGDFQLEFEEGQKFLIILEWPHYVYELGGSGGKG